MGQYLHSTREKPSALYLFSRLMEARILFRSLEASLPLSS